jgi:GMP synthase (glutamine-hydrolysing)
MPPRILIAEGNAPDVRARQKAAGKPTNADGYVAVLRSLLPDVEYAVTQPADDNWTAPDLSPFDGAVFTGSALHVYDATPQVTQQIVLARAIFDSGVPFFGSCWGLQVAAVAAGGVVKANPKGREVGLAREIRLTDAGRAHPMYRDKPHVFDAPAVHLDEIAQLPPEATVLAGNAMSAVQAVEIRHGRGVFWGVQYHPEFNAADVAGAVRRYGKLLIEEGLFASEAARDAVVRDLETRGEQGVLDPAFRLLELRNWLHARVL